MDAATVNSTAMILQLVKQFGVPAVKLAYTLIKKGEDPTDEEWLALSTLIEKPYADYTGHVVPS